MVCKECTHNPIITLPNSNSHRCGSCFNKYVQKKVGQTISKYKLIKRDDHVVVGASGGKDSTALLYLLLSMQKKLPFRMTALAIDEGIDGYRDESLVFLKNFCIQHNIELKIVAFQEMFGKKLMEMLNGQKPCSVCGVLRRYLLNYYAKELQATRLATGHNLDDEAQTILMNQFKQNVKMQARLGPITGIKEDPRFIRRIKPLYFLTEKEIATYAYHNNLMDEFSECPNEKFSFRADVRDTINTLEEKYPGTKHNIIVAFLEILPLLKESQDIQEPIQECSTCGEPCSQEQCQACKTIEKLGICNVLATSKRI